MKINPAARITGEIRVPGDKSISHRYAILGAAAEGVTRILDFSTCADCRSTLDCVSQLGVEITRFGREVRIASPGRQSWTAPQKELDAGNSGTTIRLLTGLLAGSGFSSVIRGDESLNRRPMMRIIEPLRRMGARIDPAPGGFPPLRIHGGRLTAIRYELPVASAQVKSCILLAGLTASGETQVTGKISSRDHTERALPEFKAPFRISDGVLSVRGPASLQSAEVSVPGDFSSAVFFLIAALLLPESELVIRDVGLNPTRSGLLQLLIDAGAKIRLSNERMVSGEPRGDIEITYSADFADLFPDVIGPEWVPIVIDEFPILAVLGTRLRKGLRVRGATENKKKESDRIRSIVDNLRSLEVRIDEFEDGFQVHPATKIPGGSVRTFGDHRIAMSCSIAGILSVNGVNLDEPDCAEISFPGFYEMLDSVSER